jgi:aspartyl-tRNA(Asn)/glutamyl-tRNA(Gln) amidotransferase subunit B
MRRIVLDLFRSKISWPIADLKQIRQKSSNVKSTHDKHDRQTSEQMGQAKSELASRIGLEIHARISSKTKIFSDADCFSVINSATNSNVSYFDAALPGSMPTLNRRCVELGVLTALALNCHINGISLFERKHYFYADLPAGYQITQQRVPLANKGSVRYPVIDPKTQRLTYKQCNIRRIQLEHDSARTLQLENMRIRLSENETLANEGLLIDLNRAGTGLMEIVTEPDFERAFDCYSFVRELALLLRSLGTCDAIMGEGGFRVDVNVSVHEIDQSTTPVRLMPGVRVELKNLSSFSAVLKATEYEIKRQKKLFQQGKRIEMETRTYDSQLGETISMRSKEDQYDYRFMSEPNLLPLMIYPSKSFKLDEAKGTCSNNSNLILDDYYLGLIKNTNIKENVEFYVDLDKVKDELLSKQTPQARRDYIKINYDISDEIAFLFIANDIDKLIIELHKNHEECIKENKNLLMRVLKLEYLNQINTNPDMNKISLDIKCRKIASFVRVMSKEVVSKRISVGFFAKLFDINNLNKMADEIAAEENLFMINDEQIIERSVRKLFDQNPKALNEYKTKPKNREKIFDFFVGRIHKDMNDLANPNIVDNIVLKSLKKSIE